MSSSKPFPGFDHIFDLRGPSGESAFRARLITPNDSDYLSLAKGEWVPASPLTATWYLGEPSPTLVAATGTPYIILLAKPLIEYLKRHEFTGWSSFPVILIDKDGRRYDDYVGLSIVGRCGPIDRKQGEIITDFPKLKRATRCRGIYFDSSQWDGCDFFCPDDDTAYKFVTEPVQRAFQQEGITGLRFTRATDVERLSLNDP